MTKNMKFHFLSLLLIYLSATCRAELIISESFAEGANGWIVRRENGDTQVTKNSLSYEPLNHLDGRVELRPTRDDVSSLYTKSLPRQISSGTVWLSYLMQAEKKGIGHCFVCLSSTAFVGKMWGENFSIHNRPSALPVEEGKTHRILARFDLKEGLDDIRLWVDPPLEKEPDIGSALLHESQADIKALDQLTLNCRAPGNPVYFFDEIRVGTTWADVNDIQMGDFDVMTSGPSKPVGGPFYAKFIFPVPIANMSEKIFRVQNGSIKNITKNDKTYSVLVQPKKSGTVKLTLGRGLAKASYSGANKKMVSISATFDPNDKSAKSVNYTIVDNYEKTLAGSPTASIWDGEHVKLVLSDELSPETRDSAVMQRIVKALDGAAAFFETLTAYKPEVSGSHIPIEIVPGLKEPLSKKGKAGIALSKRDFERLYSSKAEEIRPIFFEILSTNFWDVRFDDKIDYYTTPGREHGWWSKATARILALMAAEELQIEMHGNLLECERALDTYIGGRKYTWYKSFNATKLPWNEEQAVDILMTGLLQRLMKDHGGETFLKKFFIELLKRPDMKSRSHRMQARDHFFIASSKAAGKDLAQFFTEDLKWAVSSRALRIAKK